MKISELLKTCPGSTLYKNEADVDVRSIKNNANLIEEGDIYVALKGSNHDGNAFKERAAKNGAAAVVSEVFDPRLDLPQIITPDPRLCYSLMSAALHGNPQRGLKIIGVVGTNGKTSVSHLIYSALLESGKKAALIGTLGVKTATKTLPSSLTTPDPWELFSLLSQFLSEGIEVVVMELSAHAIWLKKCAAISFEILVFTNCTHDHLDYFSDFTSYRSVKKSAFNGSVRFFVVNCDDPLGREIYAESPKKTVSYGIYSPSDVFAVNLEESQSGIEFVINMFDMVYNVKSRLLGEFNAYNLLGAAAALFLLGIKPDLAVKALSMAQTVPGRMERVATFKGANIFVDYAHTPDGLNKSLSFVSSTTVGRTFCLFGCGGNRDKQKRPVMGRIAGDVADLVILTTDNPRDENPEYIMREIELGLRPVTKNYVKIVDRRGAISFAMGMLRPGDSLLIAGKGSEDYQEVSGVRERLSDREEVLSYISSHGGGQKENDDG